MSRAFQSLSSCPNCRIEAVLVEVHDPEILQGASVHAKCNFCGYESELDVVTNPGKRWHTTEGALAALRMWADKEGSSDVDAFCRDNLDGLPAIEVARRLCAQEEIGSGFDVLAFLFPGMSGGGPSVVVEATPQPHSEPLATDEVAKYSPPQDIPLVARALATVMVADGKIDPAERRVLDSLLRQAGEPPLQPDDIQLWRPIDLPLPENPDALIAAMIDVAFADNELDGSEWRVIREFARHWSCDLKALEKERKRREGPAISTATRIWRAMRTLFFTEE